MVVGETGEIVRNELGGHSSASLVGFSGDERYVGEGAVAQLATNAKNTARIGERLHGRCAEGGFTAFYAGAETAIADDALAAALLRNVGALAHKTFGGVQATALVVPNAWEESQIATLARAAAAGLDGGVEFVKADSCLRLPTKRHAKTSRRTRLDCRLCGRQACCLCVVCSFPEESSILASEASTDGSYAGTAALDAGLRLLAHKTAEGRRQTGSRIEEGSATTKCL